MYPKPLPLRSSCWIARQLANPFKSPKFPSKLSLLINMPCAVICIPDAHYEKCKADVAALEKRVKGIKFAVNFLQSFGTKHLFVVLQESSQLEGSPRWILFDVRIRVMLRCCLDASLCTRKNATKNRLQVSACFFARYAAYLNFRFVPARNEIAFRCLPLLRYVALCRFRARYFI